MHFCRKKKIRIGPRSPTSKENAEVCADWPIRSLRLRSPLARNDLLTFWNRPLPAYARRTSRRRRKPNRTRKAWRSWTRTSSTACAEKRRRMVTCCSASRAWPGSMDSARGLTPRPSRANRAKRTDRNRRRATCARSAGNRPMPGSKFVSFYRGTR